MTKEERELYHSDVKAKSDWNADPVQDIADITSLAIHEIDLL